MRTSTASIALALAALVTTAACGGDDGGDDTGDDTGFDDQEIIVGFADNVVVPTYEELADRTVALDTAVTALAATTNDTNLEAAKTAWSDMRQPWEQSEGFLFGPVSAEGWDPAMDSWPLNQTDLEAVLASGDELTQEYIRNLPETQKGFHTVEFLLWGADSQKTAAEITTRELEYMAALTEELVLITTDLETSWTTGVGGAQAYRTVFTTAGEEGNTAYPSRSSAAQEILGGMSGICDEVANGKIADPFDAMDPNLVESQYSFNSLLDFADNMRSVENAYNGDFPLGGTTGRGLTDYVAAIDPALDTRFKAEIAAAISALGEIPTPFRDAIQNPADAPAIEAAQEAIRTVQATIDGDLTAAVLGQ
jgi:putative iron-regulated protein